MNLDKRKALASRVLGVGKNKIRFDTSKLTEIKEAITKQDIRDMYADGIISIKETRGKAKIVKRTTRRGAGKIKLTIKPGKRHYVIIVRKLRRYVKELLKQEKITKAKFLELRKQIKSGLFKSKANLKEHIGGEI
jgi:large subunit ribosomal protein L19e